MKVPVDWIFHFRFCLVWCWFFFICGCVSIWDSLIILSIFIEWLGRDFPSLILLWLIVLGRLCRSNSKAGRLCHVHLCSFDLILACYTWIGTILQYPLIPLLDTHIFRWCWHKYDQISYQFTVLKYCNNYITDLAFALYLSLIT